MDQWGNIAAGIDLVRRLSGKRVHGLCFPLMLKADGTKFGKTEAGAIWLDPEMTSPFEFYQFWIRSTDADVLSYLKHFTLLDIEKITEYEKQIAEHPEKRVAQKALAYEATLLVHGETEAVKAREASEKLFSGNIQGATDEQIQTIFPNVPSTQFARDRLTQGLPLVDVLVESGLCKGKGDARRQIKAGGVYVNDVRCQETDKALTPADTASDHFLILRKGKKNYHLVQFD
jgi:tyrosyl-tRNA synthetase